MIAKIIWEAFSIALLLYGLYLAYIFMWFSMFRIFDIDMDKAKLISGTVAIVILLISSFRWLSKKRKEIQKLSEKV